MINVKAKTEYEAIALAQQQAIEEDTFYDFTGQNCNDYLGKDEEECWGWDGSSRRCDCGNRRVNWSAYETSESGIWHCYGEAY